MIADFGKTFAAVDLKMASISDIHFTADFDPTVNAGSGYCRVGGGDSKADLVANFGRMGCDAPELLVTTIFENIKNSYPDLDVIFVPGDIVAHKIAIEYGQPDETGAYQRLLGILEQVADLLIEYFPNAIVLPTLGNNDCKFHYQPPTKDEK
jgi:3',5'-cyclic AMP phosphodiesterase CpdA